jgi:transposase InsO family protein
MSLALVKIDRYAAPDFARLVEVAEAAASLHLDSGHLARLCRERLSMTGQAVLCRPPEGGAEKWHLYRSYHPALSHPLDPRFIPADLSAFSGKQQEQAMQRAACVDRLRKGRASATGTMRQITAAVIEWAGQEFPQLAISKSQLYLWDSRYQYPADLWQLVDSRGGDRKHEGCAAAWKAFEDFYLDQNQPTARQCWNAVKRLAIENGWEWCSYRACTRTLDKRIPPDRRTFHRQPATWREQCQPFTQQHPESWRAGELWIGDHKELDLICRWNGSLCRPWLTVWKDWRTRRVCGWVLSDNPNSTTILGALRHGLKEESNLGGPQHVWIDNGKDYDAWLFHGQTKKQRRAAMRIGVDEPRSNGILAMLGIKAHFSLPYCPNGKSRLERWFRTLEGFCKTFPTYTGDSIETKPERLNEILAILNLIPTFEEVYRRIGPHIAGFNASADHQIDDLSEDGLTISPNEAYVRWCDKKQVMADPAALELLMQHWHKPLTVGRNGITITLAGQALHYGQFEHALTPFKALKMSDRRTIHVSYDPHDLGTIRVFDEQFRFVCVAAMNQVGGRGTGITKETVATVARNKARHARAMKHDAEYGITATLTAEEHLAAVACEVKAIEPTTYRVIQSPLDGQAKEVAIAEFRQPTGPDVNVPNISTARKQLGANLRRWQQERSDHDE